MPSFQPSLPSFLLLLARLMLASLVFMTLPACKTLGTLDQSEVWQAEDDDDDDDDDEKIYRNIGAKYPPTATKMDWVRHSLRLFFGGYPGKEGLPDDHVLAADQSLQDFANALRQRNSLTWFGHNSFLINVGGKRILTDPTIARRIGLSPATIPRLVPNRPNWRDPINGLDRLDAVLITHADYDHLDIISLRLLRQKFPRMQIIVPEGTERMMKAVRYTSVREVAWYDTVALGGIQLRYVPAIHGVRRPPYDLDTSLWGGYILTYGGKKLYISGDIADGSVYREMAKRYGPVDVAIVPIGGYYPQNFNRAFHTTPQGTVDIARLLGARKIVASHWGTYALSEDSGQRQKSAFLEAMRKEKSGAKGVLFKIGESRRLW